MSYAWVTVDAEKQNKNKEREDVSSRGWPKLAHNEIISMNTEKEIMFYEIYFIKHYF